MSGQSEMVGLIGIGQHKRRGRDGRKHVGIKCLLNRISLTRDRHHHSIHGSFSWSQHDMHSEVKHTYADRRSINVYVVSREEIERFVNGIRIIGSRISTFHWVHHLSNMLLLRQDTFLRTVVGDIFSAVLYFYGYLVYVQFVVHVIVVCDVTLAGIVD